MRCLNYILKKIKKNHIPSFLFNSNYGVLAIYNSSLHTIFFVEENDEVLIKAL